MPDFKDSQFDYLFSAVADKYPAIGQNTDSTQFQFSGSPMAANWKTGNDINAYNIANSVSADTNGFYTPNPGSLFNAYSDMILSISPSIDGSTDPTYLKTLKLFTDASTNYQTALDNAIIAWTSYKQQNMNPKTGLPVETQAEWLADELGGLQYQTAIDDANKVKTATGNNLALLVQSLNAALASDQKKLVDPANTSNYKKADGSLTVLPTITLNGDLGTDVTNWDSYPATQYDLDVTLTKDSTVTTPWKTVYTTNVEQHCFSTSVDTSISSTRLIQDSNYKLRVMCKGLKAYNVTFGNWYSPSFVDPTTAQFSPAAGVTSETFFSATNGSLHMIPSQIWVMYQPTIELTISTDTFKETVQGTLNSSIDWVDILSFRFDCTAGASMAEVGETTTTITFNSPVLQGPQIFGVTSLKEIL
ncbi:hypothetical protein FLSI110296_13345 [Flavobacterium sinopsychrotolerans]|uniref:Uncharacterized protein n=1 Tax=Flavobacterium sinopsychrotolerans TaxID=604089 RepID=A0A1H8R1T0_9FLAO|nr:hypothetical protein [Flavobacterium sinopsychrotolerans]SEO60372.1 hypothetical protein SAMN04487942_3174 [Flavobacterium sinopsychrotolerans]